MVSGLSEESKFWLLIWTIITVFIICIAAIIAGAVVNKRENNQKLMTALIAKGQNPIILRCVDEVLAGDSSLAIICAELGKMPSAASAAN